MQLSFLLTILATALITAAAHDIPESFTPSDGSGVAVGITSLPTQTATAESKPPPVRARDDHFVDVEITKETNAAVESASKKAEPNLNAYNEDEETIKSDAAGLSSIHQQQGLAKNKAYIAPSQHEDISTKNIASSNGPAGVRLPAAAETIAHDILSSVIDIHIPTHAGTEEELGLNEELRVKLDLPPLMTETIEVSPSTATTLQQLSPTSSSANGKETLPATSISSLDINGNQKWKDTATESSNITTTTYQPVVSTTEEEDDGADVKVLENIMARAVENALEDAVNVVDIEILESSVQQKFSTIMPSENSSSTTSIVDSSSIAATSTSLETQSTSTATSSNEHPTSCMTETPSPVSIDALKSSILTSAILTQEQATVAAEPTTTEASSSPATQSNAIQKSTEFEPPNTHTSTVASSSSSTSPLAKKTDVPRWSDPIPKQSKQKPPKPPSTSINVKKPKPVAKKPKKKEERFNHASFDCGALILGSNTGASSATSILVKSKDQYMLNKCNNVAKASQSSSASNTGASGSNFVIVELCDTIKIDTLMLANFEYFSGTFKEFNVYIADVYPPKADSPNGGWLLLGKFLAANVREAQYFKVKDPLIFTRYLKVEFISYHGSEYYCPMTQIKVFGKTEMEEFREEEESIALSLAKEEEAIQEAIKNVAVRAVKDIDSVACVGDACGFEEDARRNSSNGVIGALKAGTISYDVPTTSGTATQQPSASQTSPDSVPSEEPTSYVFSADYFRLFMESQEQTSPANLDHNGKEEQQAVGAASPSTEPTGPASSPPVTSNGLPVVSAGQESIFKTISKRLALLERNSTLSYKFIEEQSRAYHAAFIRVETARADAIKKTLGECNKTMTRVVRDLAKDYEASWSLLLRDLERQRRISDSRVREIERNLEKLSDRMTRQIFYEFIMVILLVLLLTRIFSPTPIPSLALDSLSPLNSPQAFRKHFSPYFSRVIPSGDKPSLVPDINSTFGVADSATSQLASGTAPTRKPSNLQHFSTVEEDNDEDVYFDHHLDADEEVLSSPDAAYFDEHQYQVEDSSEDITESEPGSATMDGGPVDPEQLMVQRNISPHRDKLPERKSSLNLKKGFAAGMKVKIRDVIVRSEPTTPMLSSTNRFVLPGSNSPVSSSLNSKKKRRRRRSLAGLRLQSQSEFIQPTTPPSATTPPPPNNPKLVQT
ncbi:UNVERIFIED_CONTAM: hypothetical protein HDU68_000511 [Siphonaria sp. JEL0065]|nr:hypothetical protein HDU68_000511 [Siphonaria sp. JEL0065]